MSTNETDLLNGQVGDLYQFIDGGTTYEKLYDGVIYPVIVATLDIRGMISAKIVSTIQVAPEMHGRINYALLVLNQHSSRFKWQLFEEGHYALEAQRLYNSVYEYCLGYPKLLNAIVRKFATFSPLIEDVAFGRKAVNDIIGGLESVR